MDITVRISSSARPARPEPKPGILGAFGLTEDTEIATDQVEISVLDTPATADVSSITAAATAAFRDTFQDSVEFVPAVGFLDEAVLAGGSDLTEASEWREINDDTSDLVDGAAYYVKLKDGRLRLAVYSERATPRDSYFEDVASTYYHRDVAEYRFAAPAPVDLEAGANVVTFDDEVISPYLGKVEAGGRAFNRVTEILKRHGVEHASGVAEEINRADIFFVQKVSD